MLTRENLQDQEIFKWSLGPSTFRMLPQRGARLMDWELKLSGNQTRSVIHWPEGVDFQNLASIRGGNPILFPFSARTFHKGKIENWKSPSGEVLPMPKHGFARDGHFEIQAQDDSSITLKLVPVEEDALAYPFDYEFLVRYQFSMLSVEVEFLLSNLGSEKIPWSAGHHFYFTIPWQEGYSRKHYRTLMPGCKSVYHAADGALVSADFKGGEVSMDDPELVDRIHFRLKNNKVKFGLKNGEEDVTVIVSDAVRPLPGATVVTWTEFDDSPFYCVEPWMGPPNSPEHKKGLHWVEPGETDSFKVKVTLEE
ncbi:aldose epimerase [Opitutia bacterium ISCC 51]|nr:aldose epimerase [Opitutae bacterium ISCC 51]QXD28195.1 aldose epimerase [Opitutae bacterium ISCC 52]